MLARVVSQERIGHVPVPSSFADSEDGNDVLNNSFRKHARLKQFNL
jgi:hypothetical protein